MPSDNSINFTGFERKCIDFLADLKENNNRNWFDENKPIYQEYVIKPLQRLIEELSPTLISIDPLIVTTPFVGKTISRINRDTRFSNDKSPYKSNVWATFKRPLKGWQDSPCFFFEFSPTMYRYGMGFYSANRETMNKFRKLIDSNPDEFEEIASFYKNQEIFIIGGDRYKRILDSSKPADILEWYQKKNLYLVCERQIDNRFFTRLVLDDLVEGFSLAADLYHYLHKLATIK